MQVKDARERKETKIIHKETKGKKTTVVYQVPKGDKVIQDYTKVNLILVDLKQVKLKQNKEHI